MRNYFVPVIPALTVLTLVSLGSAAVAISPDLKDSLAKCAALSGAGLALSIATCICWEEKQYGGGTDE